MEDYTDELIIREECIEYIQCKNCAKQMTCVYCTGLVKYSETKGYGEIKKQ